MFSRLRRLLRFAVGERTIAINRDTPKLLELRYGSLNTVFDGTRSQITQNGKLAAAFPLVDRIELHRPPRQEGTTNWFITIHVAGARSVEVGQTTDDVHASMVAARIASITRKEVTAGPQ